MSTVTNVGTERESLLTRPFLIVTGVAFVFFVYIGMLVPIVPLFIEGPLDEGEFGIGVTVAVFALGGDLRPTAARPTRRSVRTTRADGRRRGPGRPERDRVESDQRVLAAPRATRR